MKHPTPNASHERRCHDCGNVAIHADRITPWVLCSKCGSQDTRAVKSPPGQTPTVPRAVADRLAEALQLCDNLGSRGTTDDGYNVSWYISEALADYRKAVARGK